jgi:hypothetical protein
MIINESTKSFCLDIAIHIQRRIGERVLAMIMAELIASLAANINNEEKRDLMIRHV